VFEVYATTDQRMGPSDIAEHARRAERLGFDGLLIPDAVHDGLTLATLALQATRHLRVITGVLVAFPRSPMTVAVAAWDLQAFSKGRFELGLGSQVRGNIVGRYSTAWTAPVPRMREYVQSLRAIFETFQNGTPLRFEGEHYTFTRMQPFFNPGPIDSPKPPIFMGAVGPHMTALVGEVADGLITHPSNTPPRYIREATLPRVAAGAERAKRSQDEIKVLLSPLIATGVNEATVTSEREKQRELLTFLYSTPAYWLSLELFGWKEVGERLHQLTREGKWGEMKAAISDEMLNTFVPTATYSEIPDVLRSWYGELSTRITFPMPDDPSKDPEAAKAIAKLRT